VEGKTSVICKSIGSESTQEGSEGCAELKEEDPDVVEKALRFLYTGSYDRVCPCGTISGV
jgi:hypothetical protein